MSEITPPTSNILDLHKTSLAPELIRTDSEDLLSDGGVVLATPTAEKELMGSSGEPGTAGILGESSLLPPGGLTGDKQTLRRSWERLSRVAAGLSLAALGHFWGVSVTNAFPAHIKTDNYSANASLALLGHNQISVETVVGGSVHEFRGLPTPSVIVQPELSHDIIGNYAAHGLNGVTPSAASLEKYATDIGKELGLKYLIGLCGAELIALGIYRVGRGKLTKQALLTSLISGGLVASYQASAAISTYRSDNYGGHTESGIAGELIDQSQSTINELSQRSSQIQPYISSWLALQKDLSKTFTPEVAAIPTERAPRLLLVSDIHGIDTSHLLEYIVEQYDIDAIIDSGDLLNMGLTSEADIVNLLGGIARLKVPYIVVLGNHDKNSPTDTSLVDRLVAIPNVIVLQPSDNHFTVVNIGDLRIAGVNDFDRWYGDSNTKNDEKQTAVVKKFNDTFVNNPPDIAITHEPFGAKQLTTRQLTVAGHLHKDSFDGKNIVSGTLTGGGIFGQSDSLSAKDASPQQNFSILSLDETCELRTWISYRFDGMYNGRPRLESIQIVPIAPLEPSEPKGRSCTDTAVRTQTVASSSPLAIKPVG